MRMAATACAALNCRTRRSASLASNEAFTPALNFPISADCSAFQRAMSVSAAAFSRLMPTFTLMPGQDRSVGLSLFGPRRHPVIHPGDDRHGYACMAVVH